MLFLFFLIFSFYKNCVHLDNIHFLSLKFSYVHLTLLPIQLYILLYSTIKTNLCFLNIFEYVAFLDCGWLIEDYAFR